jgi:hypothetical protein
MTARRRLTSRLNDHLFYLLTLFIHPTNAAGSQLRLRFQRWFPFYARYFQSVLPECSDILTTYYDNVTDDPACPSPCACALDCILGATHESVKANMQSASVVLGLMPTLIAVLAPSIAEIAVLSTWSPPLALLIALGTPAVRISPAAAVSGVINETSSLVMQHLQTWLARGRRRRLVLRVFLGAAAVATVANAVETSVRVDLRTASGWRCNQLFMPLVWSELSIVAFGMGMIAIRLRRPDSSFSLVKPAPPPTLPSAAGRPRASRAPRPPVPNAPTKSPLWQRITQQEESSSSEVLWTLAVVAAYVQIFFGTLVMASLIFISLQDAMFVALRYAAGCVVCRLVVAVELATMRVELARRVGSP